MANEIKRTVAFPAMAIYGVLVNASRQWYNRNSATFETPDTNARTNYAIAMAGSTLYKTGNMPAVAAGTYTLLFFSGAAASATATYPPLEETEYLWDGTTLTASGSGDSPGVTTLLARIPTYPSNFSILQIDGTGKIASTATVGTIEAVRGPLTVKANGRISEEGYVSDILPLMFQIVDERGRVLSLSGATVTGLLTQFGAQVGSSLSVAAVDTMSQIGRMNVPLPATPGLATLTITRVVGSNDTQTARIQILVKAR